MLTCKHLQITLERQALGLVDFPTVTGKDAPRKCPLCEGQAGVLHTAFRCEGMREHREALLKTLDARVRELRLDPTWDTRSEEEKLKASFAPSMHIRVASKREKFYVESLTLWEQFRKEGAKEVESRAKPITGLPQPPHRV